MRWRKRYWIPIALAAVIALVVAAVSLLRDESPPDDSDMTFARRQPAPGENGFDDVLVDADAREPLAVDVDRIGRILQGVARVRAGATVQELADEIAATLADEGWDEEDRQAIADGLPLPWDDAEVAALLEKRAGLLERIDRCLERADFVIPSRRPGARLGHLLSWKQVFTWVHLRVEVRLRAGDLDGATDDILRAMRFGQRIEDGQGDLIDVATGADFKEWGLRLSRRLAVHERATAARCVELARRLAPFEMRAAAVQSALRADYLSVSAILDDPGLFDSDLDDGMRPSLLLQPNATRRRLLPYYRAGIEIAGRAVRGEVDAPELPTGTSWLNRSGEAVAAVLGPQMVDAASRRFERLFQVRATRLSLALRGYEIEHGRLPSDAVALVPDFIRAVPADPFDGKPLRYSAEKRRVWSVGDDLVDDSGVPDAHSDARALSGLMDVAPPDGTWDLALDVPSVEPIAKERSP